MQLRRTVFGFLVAAIGSAGLISACATTVELTEEDENELLEAGTGGNTTRDGAATPPKGSSSGSSSGRSSSSGSSGEESSSSSGGSSSGGTSGMLPKGPDPDTPCDVSGREYKQGCGTCGTQVAVCQTGPAGAKVVSAYSECTGEVADGCFPDEPPQVNVACGYCGTKTVSCNNSCRWVDSTCTGEVTIAERCMPGTTKVSPAGCSAGSYRTWSCVGPEGGTDRCTWDTGPATACSPPFINVPTGTAINEREITAEAQEKRSRPNHLTCGSAVVADRWSAITEVRNTGTTSVNVDVSVNTYVDRIVAVYSSRPSTDTITAACTAVNDTCGSGSGWVAPTNACLGKITIPAGQTRWVLSSYYESSPTAATYLLRVRRSSVQP